MAKVFKDKLGQTGASAPSAIENSQNIHNAGVRKVAQTLPATACEFVTSNVDFPVRECDVLRVANTTGAVQFFNVRAFDAAAPALNATDSFALMPETVELVAIGKRADDKSQVAITSDAGVQVAIIDSPARK